MAVCKIKSIHIYNPTQPHTPIPASQESLLDDATRKAAAAWRHGTQDVRPEQIFNFGAGITPQWIPTHCACGVADGGTAHRLVTIEGEDMGMCPLTVHSLAYHRNEVDPAWVEKFGKLDIMGVDPTIEECPPPVYTANSPPQRR